MLAALPPLQTPDYSARKRQAFSGVSGLLSFIAACVSCVTLVVSLVDVGSPTFVWAAIIIIWTEGLFATACVCGVLFADPCVVRRSAERCSPPHPEVLRRLKSGETLDGAFHSNFEEPYAPFRGYCTRCFVYRSSERSLAHARSAGVSRPTCRWCGLVVGRSAKKKAAHHCSTCQRCVENFDHHCGVVRAAHIQLRASVSSPRHADSR